MNRSVASRHAVSRAEAFLWPVYSIVAMEACARVQEGLGMTAFALAEGDQPGPRAECRRDPVCGSQYATYWSQIGLIPDHD